MTGFQPAGRAPAPAPLDLLQDFVNTEIPEWAQDDLGSPAALSAWLGARGLLDPDAEPASSEAFLRARALRSCLRALALANTTGLPLEPGAATGGVDGLVGLRFGLAIGNDGAPTLAPAGEGVDRALATLAAIAVASAQARDVVAVQGVPQGHVRLDLLRPLAQPLLQLVLDDDLREPLEDCGLPAPKGRGMRAALYVVGLAFGRVRRRSSGTLLAAVGIAIGAAVLVGVLAGTKIAQDRSVSRPSTASRPVPLGAGGLVRRPGRQRAGAPRARCDRSH